MIKNYLLLLFLFLFHLAYQLKTTTQSVAILKIALSGETLIGSNIINIDNPIQGASTNTYGFF